MVASLCSARRGHLYLEPPKNWASQPRHGECASPISLSQEAVRNSSPPDRSSWPRRPLDPLVLAPLGDTKLRHVRKQTQLHPHEGSLLHRGGPIQVRRGGPIPHPAGRDPPQGCATAWPPPPCAQRRSSPPQVPLRALPAVPRHAVVPRQRGVLGRRVSQPRPESPRYPTGVRDLVCVCAAVLALQPAVVAVVLHSVCVLKAAVRPLVPCPACPAARPRCPLRDGGHGRVLST